MKVIGTRLIAAIFTLSSGMALASTSYQMRVLLQGLKAGNHAKPILPGESCQSILDSGRSVGDGVYTIHPSASSEPFGAYCDMTSAGGGWTLVLAQYEDDPVVDWNEGIQSDYDPSLAARRGFALNTQEIPGHDQVSFGKDLDASAIDFVTHIYSTGNIPKTLLRGVESGSQYHLHRAEFANYGSHNPENPIVNKGQDDIWRNTLTFDLSNPETPSFTWSFSPRPTSSRHRGFAFGGDGLSGTSEPYAWTLWVR